MKTNAPLISIIVPIYQVERYIEQCINSIICQSYWNLEIILVDDGSKDGCGKICDNYASNDNRIIVVHKENGGLVSARKAGAKIATGDYITFVDGDDWISANYLEKLAISISDTKADILIAGYTENRQNCSEIQYVNKANSGMYNKKQIEDEIVPGMLNSIDNMFSIIPAVWNKLFKRELLLKCLGDIDDNVTLGEDLLCSYHAIILSNEMVVNNDITEYHYRINELSMTGRSDVSFLIHVEALYRCLNSIFNDTVISCRQINKYKEYILLIDGIINIEKESLNRFKLMQNLKAFNNEIISTSFLYNEICKWNKSDIKWINVTLKNLVYRRSIAAVLSETILRRLS